MKIKSVSIKNFRRLKSSKIDISEKKTVFVGANNSGKTTAMNAICTFLADKKFHTQDFTLSNWTELNSFGHEWEKEEIESSEEFKKTMDINSWDDYLPQFDLWLDVNDSELHYISHIIPTLDWKSGLLGVRLRLEPKDLQNLYANYSEDYKGARKNAKGKEKITLYPRSLWDYLDRANKLNEFFEIRYYILDPDKYDENQSTPKDYYNGDPLKGLIKIDTIQAQRGFSDANGKDTGLDNLSKQLQNYYRNHLSPEVEPTEEDLEALSVVSDATTAFGERLKKNFSHSLGEIETMNYPGFDNPLISIEPALELVDGLNHQSSVRFSIDKENGSELCLSEKYNGLGYQNLISMSYKLIGFRDDWMRVGKQSKGFTSKDKKDIFEPLHLVLIEEPEAHLHVQVQLVFVRKAYDLLRNHKLLKEREQFSTQLIVSTHSSSIAHDVEYENLRYFKREHQDKTKIPTTKIINLSETFGKGNSEAKFVTRYLKTTHCDLFFADAVILVEGAAERILVPFFIERNFKKLSVAYISILEILGSHAHTLKPLIEKLGIITLIITDIDTKKGKKKVLPCLGNEQITNNDTIKNWIPREEDIDTLVKLPYKKKEEHNVRIAYQYEKKYIYREKTAGGKESTANLIPYTFEDALALDNISFIRDMNKPDEEEGKKKPTGLLKKFCDALDKENPNDAAQAMYEALNSSSKKAAFAIDLLYSEDMEKITVPSYISEGLQWMEEKLTNTRYYG